MKLGIVALGTACVGVCLIFLLLPKKNQDTRPLIVQSAPTIERVEALGDLCVLRIRLSDMLIAESPDYRAVWLIMGDAMISIDLRQVSLQTDAQAKTLRMQMPALQVTQPRVDHERTRWWDTRSVRWHNGWLTSDKTGKTARLTQATMIEAQRMIETVSRRPEFMDEARKSAEAIVTAMYSGTGYTVSFQWSASQN
ncbi:MAG TPA: DUF4230 domain-containing protein [Planctomycetaceae bacterium]|nr:DUF4230 domain-containing protein [Planctomycetaceae bacterium]HQZ63649.1 DUF4230 domain-containing protein [Planctomycetaceae bacterium]